MIKTEAPPNAIQDDQLVELLTALTALREGRRDVRLPSQWTGVSGKVASAFAEVAELNERMADELARLRRVAGREGGLRQRLSVGDVSGFWRDSVDSVNDLIDDLVCDDRNKSEFLAMLAHELRNPLAPVRNAIEVLNLDGLAPDRQQWARGVIDRQMQQMTRLIDDLLDMSRITRNQLELRRERVTLAEVVQGAIETSRPLIESHGHRLTVTLPAEPVYLEADLTRLAQVLLNLLNNAAKYTENGGLIELEARRGDGDVAVVVRDTGIGIPREQLPRIFDMFTRLDRSLEKSQGGLGIGLTLVKRLVDMHGGTITADSEGPGLGSEFTLRLPVARPPAAASPSPSKRLVRAPQPFRILVADDNTDAADTLGMLLESMGHSARVAYDGLEAIEAAQDFQPEVAFIDVGMPRLNGLDACRRLRADHGSDAMVLIALTGWGQDEDRRRTREAGFDHHMVKPVDPTQLIRILAELQAVRG